jgi:hypothetical protein
LKYGSDRHTESKSPRKQNVFKGFLHLLGGEAGRYGAATAVGRVFTRFFAKAVAKGVARQIRWKSCGSAGGKGVDAGNPA